ncbi:MAG: B12-binding domain-containing radical SAM protein [Magnetococcales bacterium]|nr:B12-binding domain-containing radical SAM protein [Magnetococcales bacterium]MBF0321655.1 B12-binding domain-containing radical SAM protein [Magnetococcales bacterium]
MKILFVRNSCLLMSHSQLSYGLGVIATMAHQGGHTVQVLDNNTHYRFFEMKDVEKRIRSFLPDVLAYSITMHNAFETYRQVSHFRKLFPGMIIIAGGIHMRHCTMEALQHGIHAVVEQEGELVILPLLAHLTGRTPETFVSGLESVAGVSFVRRDGTFHRATEFPALEDLDAVPIVDYDLFNLSDYIKTGREVGNFYINGQRGCPFKCTFCADEVQLADKRSASGEWMFNNVAALYQKYGVRYILLADNNITLHQDRLIDFCNRMIESGLNEKVTFSSQTTTRFKLSDELVALMKRAGFVRINFGLERLTPFALASIKKVQHLDNVHRVLSLVAKHGIQPSIFVMIGFPFDNKNLIEEERQLFLDITRYTKRLFISILAPAPGTAYYDDNPGIKEWYLDEKEYLMLRAHFTNVLDMHTFHTIKKNFFGLPPETTASIEEFYNFFKKYCYGSFIVRPSILTMIMIWLDFGLARVSQGLFMVSPALEFAIFKRIRGLRYYFGTLFFSANMERPEAGSPEDTSSTAFPSSTTQAD